jgi:hypothetical protein
MTVLQYLKLELDLLVMAGVAAVCILLFLIYLVFARTEVRQYIPYTIFILTGLQGNLRMIPLQLQDYPL